MNKIKVTLSTKETSFTYYLSASIVEFMERYSKQKKWTPGQKQVKGRTKHENY